MGSILKGAVIAFALAGVAGAQEGKEREKGKDGKREPSIGLKDVDTNGDGRASVSEIRAALAKLTGDGRKEGQNKERRRDGDGGKERREGKGQEPSIALKDLDTNGDGRASVSELQAALENLTAKKEGGDKKEEGEKRK